MVEILHRRLLHGDPIPSHPFHKKEEGVKYKGEVIKGWGIYVKRINGHKGSLLELMDGTIKQARAWVGNRIQQSGLLARDYLIRPVTITLKPRPAPKRRTK